MNTNHPNQIGRLFAERRLSRRQALTQSGAGIAATALATTGLVHTAGAQGTEATPAVAADTPGVTPEGVAAAAAQLDTIVADALERSGVPGVAVVVVYQDEVVHVAGYGEREVGTGEMVDADTVFQLASVSKPLAATTVAAVVGDGVVTWDSRLSDLDPTFAMYDPWITHEVTVRDLFSHRSGLADHIGDDLEDLGFNRAEILHRMRFMRPEGRFRDSYAYTNFGLTAAAVGVATSVGQEWEDLAATRLYEPLGMTSTSSRFDDFMASPNRASAHVPVDGAYVAKYQRQPDAQSPAGGVSSSVTDLAQWLRLLIGAGTISWPSIVPAAALQEMFRPNSAANRAGNPAIDRTGFYGLGWNVSFDPDGRVRVSHSGAFSMGAGTTVTLLPVDQLGIMVLANARANGVAEAIAQSFMDIVNTGAINNDYLEIFTGIFAASLAPKYGTLIDYTVAPAEPVPSLSLETYAGDYENDFYGDIVVGLDGDALVLQLGPDLTAYPMRHYDHDVFLYQPVGENAEGESAVTFTVGADRLASDVTIEILDISHQGTFTRDDASA